MCAIRVSFPLENDESTTGDGQFLNTARGINCFEYTIDKPPHNRSYFESQIKAVSSYFDSVSYGTFKVDLENSDIFPYGEDSSYELDSSMASYNPYDQSSQSEEKITRLFQDAIILASFEDEINYSNYTAVTASGYEDLQILQTPVLEAFTNNASSMKSKLIKKTFAKIPFALRAREDST